MRSRVVGGGGRGVGSGGVSREVVVEPLRLGRVRRKEGGCKKKDGLEKGARQTNLLWQTLQPRNENIRDRVDADSRELAWWGHALQIVAAVAVIAPHSPLHWSWLVQAVVGELDVPAAEMRVRIQAERSEQFAAYLESAAPRRIPVFEISRR